MHEFNISAYLKSKTESTKIKISFKYKNLHMNIYFAEIQA